MTSTQIEALAEYLTGPAVAHASVSLQAGGTFRRSAEAFFALREAFGVRGYPSKDDVLAALYADSPFAHCPAATATTCRTD